MTRAELARFNRRAPDGTSPRDLEIDPRFGLPRWYVDGRVNPTISPVDFIGAGGVAKAAGNIMKTSVVEAAATVRVLQARMMGRVAAEESAARIKQAADAVEEFLGGRPDPKDLKINSKGDITIIKGDKKFRMDINYSGFKNTKDGNQVPDDPHFHFLEYKDGDWVDAGDIHRYYFKKLGE